MLFLLRLIQGIEKENSQCSAEKIHLLKRSCFFSVYSCSLLVVVFFSLEQKKSLSCCTVQSFFPAVIMQTSPLWDQFRSSYSSTTTTDAYFYFLQQGKKVLFALV